MRLIDADALKKQSYRDSWNIAVVMVEDIDKSPTVEPTFKPIAEVKFDKEQLQEIVDKAKAEVLASVERPQGEWVKIGEIGLAYKCDKCEEVSIIPTNFCSNCGAKMKKGNKDNGQTL